MKIPLFQALLDVQNLSQLYHGLHYTQSVAVHIKNNQLEMPLLSKLTVTSPTQPTERFLDYIEQIINVYEPTLYGIKIQTATDTIVKKITEAGEAQRLVGNDDHSDTHYVITFDISDHAITFKGLLPVSSQNPKGYTPPIAKQLRQAAEHLNTQLT